MTSKITQVHCGSRMPHVRIVCIVSEIHPEIDGHFYILCTSDYRGDTPQFCAGPF